MLYQFYIDFIYILQFSYLLKSYILNGYLTKILHFFSICFFTPIYILFNMSYFSKNTKTHDRSQINIHSVISVPDLVTNLQNAHSKHKNKLKLQLLGERKKQLRIKRSLVSYEIQQPTIIINSISKQFEPSQFLSKDDKFIQYKIRRNLVVPERAFSKIPNIKIGLMGKNEFGSPEHSLDQERRIISQKFEQFNSIIDSQDGSLKKKLYAQKLNKQNGNVKNTMKKTFFSKPSGDQYNFYQAPSTIQSYSSRSNIFDLTSIRKLSAKRLKTIRTLKTNELSKLVTDISQADAKYYLQTSKIFGSPLKT